MKRNRSRPVSQEFVCGYRGHSGLQLNYFPHYMFNVILSATITLSSRGAEVRDALVPFYCRLGLKSGPGTYSGEKRRKDMNCSVTANAYTMTLFSSQHYYFQSQTCGRLQTSKISAPCIPQRINTVTQNQISIKSPCDEMYLQQMMHCMSLIQSCRADHPAIQPKNN